ncbi:hypothetical protein CIRMBP1293_01142 [Enterococcus cecorum]|nr:hypothetical protein CIRMBP1293_01142 [Enterococcus cecorum]
MKRFDKKMALYQGIERKYFNSTVKLPVQVRRFEKEGVEKCIVTYDSSTETFELTEAESNQPYQFDNIDIVAMEIYDLIQ